MRSVDSIHPGILVRHLCLEIHDLSVTDAAFALGVSRQALSNLLSGKAGVSPDMAIRLDLVFGGSAEIWLQRQAAYDLAQARKRAPSLVVRALSQKAQPEVQPELF